ncbi:TLD-domain-containing protein [Polychytrium aggregatum]|uniref:TLD-domain-containing protein n=1 Tax=Polychytrium aggregatum TaxID=110093 RepID=UPI0022FE8715|nr:TLD-domain-containing protein [Polychytrium aggregatum]KAI9183765.1 TLD-domain-containing protein [Polychytrium aggregatum]
MPNPAWVNLRTYEADPPFAGWEAEWDDQKLERLYRSDNLGDTKLKKMVRRGIPDSLRGHVYAKLLKLGELDEHDRNFEIAKMRVYGEGAMTDNPIAPTFGGRSFRYKLSLNNAGRTQMEHILCILAYDFPNLEYCPFVPALTAMLCHHMNSADDALGAMVCIVRKSLGETLVTARKGVSDRWEFFPTYRKEVKLMSRAFGNMLYKCLPKVHAKLVELQERDESPIWSSWLSDMLADVLPQPILWRLLDDFLVEGYKPLFRFCAALLKIYQGQIMEAQTSQQVLAFLTPHNILCSANEVAEEAWMVKFDRANITKMLVHHRSLTAISISDDLHEIQYKYQRATPRLKETSSILDEDHWIAVWSWIPPAQRVVDVELLFTTSRHGYHISTLFHSASDIKPTLLVVKTSTGEIFGAYISSEWPTSHDQQGRFSGNGESFLFMLEPRAKMYPWVGRDIEFMDAIEREIVQSQASMFIMATRKDLSIGAGGGEIGLYLDETLQRGSTGPCMTFGNDPLTGSNARFFETHSVELFAFL